MMDEQGIDRAMMWPTLASLLEERLADDPVTHPRRRPRAQPVDARAVDVQLREPDLPHPGHHAADPRQGDRGARVGRRARRQGDPGPPGAGARLQRASPLVRAPRVRPVLEAGRRRPASSSGCTPPTAAPSATSTSGRATTASSCRSTPKLSALLRACMHAENRMINDVVSSIIGHGLATRFPDLRFMPVENGSSWVRPLVEQVREGLRPRTPRRSTRTRW